MNREYPDRPIVGVGAIIVQDGRAVVVKRVTEPLKGQWSIPGGMLELGEKLREGAAREALEETGLHVEAGEVVEVFDALYKDENGRMRYHYVLIDFVCRPIAGELCAASDVAEARWITESELDSLAMTENTVRVIKKALKKSDGRTIEKPNDD